MPFNEYAQQRQISPSASTAARNEVHFTLLAGLAVSPSALSRVPNVVVAHAGLICVLLQEF